MYENEIDSLYNEAAKLIGSGEDMNYKPAQVKLAGDNFRVISVKGTGLEKVLEPFYNQIIKGQVALNADALKTGRYEQPELMKYDLVIAFDPGKWDFDELNIRKDVLNKSYTPFNMSVFPVVELRDNGGSRRTLHFPQLSHGERNEVAMYLQGNISDIEPEVDRGYFEGFAERCLGEKQDNHRHYIDTV